MRDDEEEAFRAFVATHWQALLRTTYLMVGDHGHAEDLVQTALVRVHRRWRSIERKDAPVVYVKKVIVNLVNGHWRRRLRLREEATAQLPEPDGYPGSDAMAVTDQRDELWEALRSLPRRMRAVLVLRYFEDMTEAQTAEVLGCSVGTVKSQTSRGLDRLRQGLADADTAKLTLPDSRGGIAR